MKSALSNYTTCALALALGVLTSLALADPGHIEAVGDGHSHLLALGAVCVALIIAGFGILYNIQRRKLKA